MSPAARTRQSPRARPEAGAAAHAPSSGAREQLPADHPGWADEAREGLGVYVHVPFCARRCGYCDFAAYAGLDDLANAYVCALREEIAARVLVPASTIFVGGGTPSRLPPHLLHRVISGIPRTADAECTVEMNPESASADVLAAARDAGATRLSLGMQSAQPHVLAFLERAHDVTAVGSAVERARAAGFEDLNLDLIYGTPGESVADWATTLEAALALDPDHISAYALTVEGGTRLGRAIAAGEKPATCEDTAADCLRHCAERLATAGFVRYEISNWARGRPCVHNLAYWSDGAYVGVGSAAHSYDPPARRRSWNVRHPARYVALAGSAEAGAEVLTDSQIATERLLLGLRRACGIDAAGEQVPEVLIDSGLVVVDRGRIRLTEGGMFVADAVCLSLSSREC